MLHSKIRILLFLLVFSIGFMLNAQRTTYIDITAYGAHSVDEPGYSTFNSYTAIQSAINAAFLLRSSNTLYPGLPNAVYYDTIPAILFPSGRYRIDGTLLADKDLRFIAPGRASIEVSGNFPALMITNAYQIDIHGLVFVGGTNAIQISNPNTESAMVTIEECEFQGTTSWAIIADGTGAGADHMSTHMQVRRCKFNGCAKGILTYCDYTQVQDSWITWGDQVASNTAFFENHCGANVEEGGFLILENITCVPTMALSVTKVRWIDNYSRVIARRSRFGMEADGGWPIVYNYAPYRNINPFAGGGVIITDSELWAGCSRPDGGVVILQGALPSMIVLENNLGPIQTPYIRNDSSNGGIANLTTYINGAVNPLMCFRFHIGSMMPSQQNSSSTLGTLLIPSELLPYTTGTQIVDVEPITAGANMAIGTDPNAPKSYLDPSGFVRLAGILRATGSVTAGTTIGTVNSLHRPSRNIAIPIVLSTNAITYLKINSVNGAITIGTALSNTQQVQLDGITYKQKNLNHLQ